MSIDTHDERAVIQNLDQCPECGTRERNCHVIKFHEVPVDTFVKIMSDAAKERGWKDCLVENIPGGYRMIGKLACECGEKETAKAEQLTLKPDEGQNDQNETPD